MKFGLGLYRTLLTSENVRFARQIGVTHIVAHIPGGFSRGKGKVITSDVERAGFGVSDGDDPVWTFEGLADLKAMIEAEGLTLDALENFEPAHWYDVLLDGPRRGEQMAHLRQIVRDVGRLGIPTIGYNFSLAGVWGRSEGAFARGGARSVGFADPPQTPIPAGMVWNMVYDPDRFDPAGQSGVIGSVTAAEMWDRLGRFLAELLPVAEEASVRLGHPPGRPAPPGVARHGPPGDAPGSLPACARSAPQPGEHDRAVRRHRVGDARGGCL